MISADDRQALDRIEEGLAASSPRLAAMLATFARLNAGERMPARERIRAREGPGASHDDRRGRPQGLASEPLLWLVVSVLVVLLAAATGLGLAARHGARRPCTDFFSLVCSGQANPRHAFPATRQVAPGRAVSRARLHG